MDQPHLSGATFALPLCIYDLNLIQEDNFIRSHLKDPVTNTKPVIVVTSPWSERCWDWNKSEGCDRGIMCGFQHLGHPVTNQWCTICGAIGHTAMECKRRGGGQDPCRHQAWHTYRTQDRMLKFLSQLTQPKGRGLDGTYFYLFADTEQKGNWNSWSRRGRCSLTL